MFMPLAITIVYIFLCFFLERNVLAYGPPPPGRPQQYTLQLTVNAMAYDWENGCYGGPIIIEILRMLTNDRTVIMLSFANEMSLVA